MALSIKKVLFINLSTKSYEVKTFSDLSKYIGGVGLGLKLLQQEMDSDPILFSIGPLNGYFPFASKTNIVMNSDGVIEDLYLGGSFSSRLKFTGLDSICIQGVSKEPVVIDIIDQEVRFLPVETDSSGLGLPGKRSVLSWGTFGQNEKKLLLGGYFTTPEKILEKKFFQKGVRTLSVTGTKTFEVSNKDNYEAIYAQILARQKEVSVLASDKPSCVGCPLGCDKSQVGEIGGNVLIHSLVACEYSEKLFSDIGIVFSCLNVLGYDYTHEDLEILPKLIDDILKDLS
jgi:aldehyde:ferredoxin oxidoreductase